VAEWLNRNPARCPYSATVAALVGIGPMDELEGMMAAQLIAAHNAAMECYRRAMLGEQTFEGRRENLSQANKLSRTYATLLEALNRSGQGPAEGHGRAHPRPWGRAEAVVGVVGGPGGGDRTKPEEQPHAKQIAHPLEPALPSPDASRDALPIGRDGEPGAAGCTAAKHRERRRAIVTP
jgi:hypothetical protein